MGIDKGAPGGDPQKTPLELLNKKLREITLELEDYKKIYKLQSAAGFIQEFYECLPGCKTAAEAFDLVNIQYYNLTGVYRFANITAFYKALNKYIENTNL